MFDCNLFEQYLACLHSSAIQNDHWVFKHQEGTTWEIDEVGFEVIPLEQGQPKDTFILLCTVQIWDISI